MANMRTIMPAIQRAKPTKVGAEGTNFASVTLPKLERETKVVKDVSAEEVAQGLIAWLSEK